MIFFLLSNADAASFLDGDGVGSSGEYGGLSLGVARRNSTLSDRNGAAANLVYTGVGVPVSAFIGHQFGVGLRIEGELFYKGDSADKLKYAGITHTIDSSVWSLGAMGNLYYDFYHDLAGLKNLPVSPFVGLGVGVASVSVSGVTVNGLRLWNDGQAMVLAYQAFAGIGIPVGKDIVLDVSYRYFGTSKAHPDQIAVDYTSNNFLLGVRYLFR